MVGKERLCLKRGKTFVKEKMGVGRPDTGKGGNLMEVSYMDMCMPRNIRKQPEICPHPDPELQDQEGYMRKQRRNVMKQSGLCT